MQFTMHQINNSIKYYDFVLFFLFYVINELLHIDVLKILKKLAYDC